jgi:16S rRNA processing protein RimM
MVILMLDGVDDMDKARALKNKVLFMKREDAKLPKNVWFRQELFDCKVFNNETGAELGVITDVSETGANDVWHIKTANGEVLIPAIKEVVAYVDVVEGIVKINVLKGLFEDED